MFEEVEDMVDCLQCIMSDGEVAVERVKNRLDEAFDSMESCGYRSVDGQATTVCYGSHHGTEDRCEGKRWRAAGVEIETVC